MPWTYSWVFRRWFLCPVKSVRELVFEAAGKECPPFAGMRQVVINTVNKHKSLLKPNPKLRGTVEAAAAEIDGAHTATPHTPNTPEPTSNRARVFVGSKSPACYREG